MYYSPVSLIETKFIVLRLLKDGINLLEDYRVGLDSILTEDILKPTLLTNSEIEDVAETLTKFKNEGKIGGFGFSEIAPSSLRRAHAVHPVTAVQNEYSLWTRIRNLECCRPALNWVLLLYLSRLWQGQC